MLNVFISFLDPNSFPWKCFDGLTTIGSEYEAQPGVALSPYECMNACLPMPHCSSVQITYSGTETCRFLDKVSLDRTDITTGGTIEQRKHYCHLGGYKHNG